MEHRPHVLVLADDLSGAADCSVAWTRRGDRAVVALDAVKMGREAAVLAIDMNTRNLSAENARATATHAIEVCGELAAHILYQKMDSALRGNWATELSAIRGVIGRRAGAAPLAIVAPALPSAGRAIVGGCGLIRGKPLEESSIWRDGAMAGTAGLPRMLAGAGIEARLLPLAAARAGGGALAASLREFASRHVPAVVCDAESEEDLAAIARSALGIPGCIWVGSAGLMHALVAAMGAPQAPGDRPSVTVGDRPILTVVGSASEVSGRQFQALSQEAGVVPLQIPVEDLLSGMAAARVHRSLKDALNAGMDAAVTVSPGQRAAPADGPRVTAALGAVVAPHLARLGGLVITGGETARAIFDAAGVRMLEMLFEIEPGVPIGRTVGEVRIPAITKSGSFGDDRTLIRCRNALRRAAGDEREIGPGRAGGLHA